MLCKERTSERRWSSYPSRREGASSSLHFENHFWEYEHLQEIMKFQAIPISLNFLCYIHLCTGKKDFCSFASP